MACNSCGGSQYIRIERTNVNSQSMNIIRPIKMPLRPQKIRNTENRKIQPANHLDKRM